LLLPQSFSNKSRMPQQNSTSGKISIRACTGSQSRASCTRNTYGAFENMVCVCPPGKDTAQKSYMPYRMGAAVNQQWTQGSKQLTAAAPCRPSMYALPCRGAV
jgi:hypothetical protein